MFSHKLYYIRVYKYIDLTVSCCSAYNN